MVEEFPYGIVNVAKTLLRVGSALGTEAEPEQMVEEGPRGIVNVSVTTVNAGRVPVKPAMLVGVAIDRAGRLEPDETASHSTEPEVDGSSTEMLERLEVLA